MNDQVNDIIEKYASQADDPEVFRRNAQFGAAAYELTYNLAPFTVPIALQTHPEYLSALKAYEEAQRNWIAECGDITKPGSETQAYKEADRHLREVASDLTKRWNEGPL